MKSEDAGTRASSPTITEEQDWNAKDSDGLLKSKENHESEDGKPTHFLQRKIPVKLHLIIFSFCVLSLLGMAALLARSWRGGTKKPFLYSPANEAVEYYIGEFSDGNDPHGMYVGEPRPSLEKAWQDLLGPMNVRLSLQDVQAFGREATAVGMSDGSGYIGTLNVYHELHCVRWLHKYVYQEHYWPGLDDEQRRKNRIHSKRREKKTKRREKKANHGATTDHCLGTLKSFAMCHGDVGMVIYSWQKDVLKPGANGTGHTCVNWDKISKWTEERTVNMYEPGLIIHPQLGPAYAEEENSNEEHIYGALHSHGGSP
ncbi:hypothetical protein ISF_01084 [Cordyceps fumosorosea ARSEF 2679]|uniref:Tat pathway signal sequence n=1 Tax=Cordyceps fumosorosea (strain ARSEF 2679) TaxID=1081104 RepID=A0A168ET42_CORFA|nr:hypothetical protein ISF_01084 [Cordyceps fumosorosea ARSEF 2679]OAA74183.1 hypothetical protein ISF_01084 [Cordyceps fumosorosea ARSEF 2679]